MEDTRGASQKRWHDIVDHFEGDEERARSYVKSRILEMLALMEADGYPDVFGVMVPLPGKPLFGEGFDGIMSTVQLTLSHVWPG